MQPMQGSTWRGRAAGVVLGALALGGMAAADTICVPDDYDTIQEAIDAAFDGDEICVAPGTYNEKINFNGKPVRLYSTDGREVTTIDGTGRGGIRAVVRCENAEGPDTILEGFTLTGGHWPGGGMHNDGSSPTVTNCTFTENNQSGGMWNRNASSPTVTNCRFTDNIGGGMGNYDNSNSVVTDCLFNSNEVTDWGGGGMLNDRSSPTVTGCTFRGNNADNGGAGGMLNVNSHPAVTNCTFRLNGGAGMHNIQSTPTVTSCIFDRNGGANGGGGVSGGGRFANCIFWDNTPNSITGTPVVTYSDVEGGYEGVGNIDADPLLGAGGRPQAGSPCIDAGANNAVPADLLDLDDDGDTAERVPIDLDGNHRFMDDGKTVDTGCGPIVVDMGAYEFLGEPMHPVLIGDIDGDGIVGFNDLVQVLSFWGECDPGCCLADVNFTWAVDFDDLLIVLDNWI